MAGPQSGGVSFMRMIFEATKESVEEKESSIRSMVEGYQKKGATQQAAGVKADSDYGGTSSSGKTGGKDAMSTSESLALQFEMGQYTQMATGASNMMKAIKDLLSAIMRNVG